MREIYRPAAAEAANLEGPVLAPRDLLSKPGDDPRESRGALFLLLIIVCYTNSG